MRGGDVWGRPAGVLLGTVTRRKTSAALRAVACAASLVGVAAASGQPDSGTTWVGVLQEFDYILGGSQLRPQVRVAFTHDRTGWHALPDGSVDVEHDDQRAYAEAGRRLWEMLPERQSWTICFDGRSTGRVDTLRPDAWGPRQRGSLLIAPGQEVRWVGKRTTEFSGVQQVPVHRPRVVTTSARCSDPDRWKRMPFDRAELVRILPSVRTVLRADNSPWATMPEKYLVPLKAYGSAGGDRLYSVGSDEGGAGFLFYLPRGGEMRLLGSGAATVIDTGDYDGDGHSELVVMEEEDTRNGIVLFFNGFRDRVSFSWDGYGTGKEKY